MSFMSHIPPPYAERDIATNTVSAYQSINFLPEYRHLSFEELRLKEVYESKFGFVHQQDIQPIGNELSTYENVSLSDKGISGILR